MSFAIIDKQIPFHNIQNTSVSSYVDTFLIVNYLARL